jgi:glyoxylate/hydroxypyruvate reductase
VTREDGSDSSRNISQIETRIWPDIGRKEDVDAALVWKHPHGVLRQFPELKVIVNLGVGVNFVLADPELPANVPIVRLVDQGLTRRITEYVVLHIEPANVIVFADADRGSA